MHTFAIVFMQEYNNVAPGWKGCFSERRINFSNYNVYKVSNLDNLFVDRYEG